MKLTLILSLFAISGAFAADKAPEAQSPEQLRKGLKKRGLQASDGSDSGGDTGGGSSECFSAVTTVEVQGKGTLSMDSLKIGDYVRAGKDGDFSRVFSFGHLDTDLVGDFLQIYSEGKDQPIEITPNHMIFVDNKPVKAETVKIGDMLDEAKVTKISSIKRSGVFAPITESGEINVSGVRASSYVAFVDGVVVDQHALVHMFFAPQRVLCGINFAWCENETYTDGFSNWSNWAIQIYMKANEWSAFAKHAASVLAVLILPPLYTAEQFIVSPILSLAVLGYAIYKSTTKKVKSV
jgi:hypothetical protein